MSSARMRHIVPVVAIASLLSVPIILPAQDSVRTADSTDRTVAARATPITGVRHPSSSPDGVLAFARDGHLYTQRGGEPAARVSSGSAWHRDPRYGADSTLYYASDAAGQYDLFVLRAGRSERLTSNAAHDVSPSPAPDGRLIFQRGLGNESRLWVRLPDGSEQRLTSAEQTERQPRVSRDGRRVAWLSLTETQRRVIVRPLDGGAEIVAYSDPTLEDVAWSPDGRLALSLRTGTVVVNVTGVEAERYTHLVSRLHGDVDWSPDGVLISIAERREVTVSYNGDPDRGVDRAAHERIALSAGTVPAAFVRVPAPLPPDAGRIVVAGPLPNERTLANAAAFDRMWERSARLYFAQPSARRTRWEAVRSTWRPRALAAPNNSALQIALHGALRERPPLREEARGQAAVSSAHPVATEAGLAMFQRGGNVIDAAVAVSFALGVVEPDASGIGGYGEMVIALAGRDPTLIEFMSRVPEEGGLDNKSLLVNGRYPSDGPTLTNVPGTVAGMYLAWQRYGSKRLTWAELLAPAIRAAREGYVVSEGLATTLRTEREHFAKYDGSRALFFRNGQPLATGDTLRNPDLAWVLEQIATNGADGFYKGDVAAKYAGDLRAKGNAMKVSDLARYFANERAPVCGTYRVYRLCSGAPPVSGGADLVARLNLLEQFPGMRSYVDHAPTLHAMLSAWSLTPSSRNRIADPAMWPVDVASIVHKDTAKVRWQCFNADSALTPAAVRGDTIGCLRGRIKDGSLRGGSLRGGSLRGGSLDGGNWGGAGLNGASLNSASLNGASLNSASLNGASLNGASLNGASEEGCGDDHAAEMTVCHAAGTTAFTVADADGNAVAVTQTLGTWGGTFYVTPGLGFLSNDKLTSYGTDPTQYGSRLPFARHGSTLAPTIAFRGNRPVFAIGAAGNAWITSAVYQGLIGALDFNLGPQAALELPRFLPSGNVGPRYTIQLEDGFAPQVISRLQSLGYDLSFVSAHGELREGYGAAVRIERGHVTAGADPRRSGAAGAVGKR